MASGRCENFDHVMEREGCEGKIKQILHCDLLCQSGNDLEITFRPYEHISTSDKWPVKMARFIVLLCGPRKRRERNSTMAEPSMQEKLFLSFLAKWPEEMLIIL